MIQDTCRSDAGGEGPFLSDRISAKMDCDLSLSEDWSAPCLTPEGLRGNRGAAFTAEYFP
jgi:hypothetical protein